MVRIGTNPYRNSNINHQIALAMVKAKLNTGDREMAQSPKYKVYKGDQYVGCVKDATDAAVLVSIQEQGTVRLGHKRILWTEGVDGLAGESYDAAAEKILEREHNNTR